MKPLDLYRQWGSTHFLNESQECELGFQAQRLAEEDAETGSRNLRAATQSLFRNWEREHGFQSGAAAILLPAGYNPDREAA